MHPGEEPAQPTRDGMKAVFALVISWIVLVPRLTTAQTVPARGRMSVSYVPPKNPAHQPIYEQLKEIRFLESAEFLSRVRLPARYW